MIHYYPGSGLGLGTAPLTGMFGQEYAAAAPITYCTVYGTLVLPDGVTPVGYASTKLVDDSDGTTRLVDVWNGDKVSAYLTVPDDLSYKTITTTKMQTFTNENGYFEFKVVQGLTITINSTSIGSIPVDTTGEVKININTLL